MSAHRTPPEARAIVQVLRNGAIAQTGSLLVHEVEVLERVLRANAALVEALEAVLLFHSGAPWDEAKQERWLALVGGDNATTKALCDRVRAALALAGVKP